LSLSLLTESPFKFPSEGFGYYANDYLWIPTADQNPLKLLCSNSSNRKWILVKSTSHLWQITFTIPKRRSCHYHFWQNLLSNFL